MLIVIELKKTIKDMIDIAESYGHVTKADLYDLIELEPDYTDTKVYWIAPAIKEAEVVRIYRGWTILFPSPIDERSTVVNRHVKNGYYRSERYNKPESKNLSIVLNSDHDDFADTLGCVFEYVSTVKDREIFITIT